ncbi:MAG TPA: tetratricopeptide repeat protein, partial [Kofleriaceae bacterium]|nr:tetratricopeptide repeat protein [Kofleriaceae bacterium]
MGVELPPEPAPQRVGAIVGDLPPIPSTVPPRLAVAPFENHSSGETLQWMIAATPFEIAEKSEQALRLEPAYDPLVVGAPILPNEKGVNGLALARDADLVITGWVERPGGTQLRLVAQLWKRTGAQVGKVAQAERLFAREQYHAMLGEVLADLWTEAGFSVGAAEREVFARAPVGDPYAVQLFGRGLGYLCGAFAPVVPATATAAAGSAAPGPPAAAPGVDLKAAERDLAKAVLIAPKLAEAQRIFGELLLMQAQGDGRVISRAAGKFAYASDLRPDYVPALRAAATAAAAASKREIAAELLRRLVRLRPWDLELRYRLGEALWSVGEGELAVRELERVLTRSPQHLPARRALAVVRAARGDLPGLIRELEVIEALAPQDPEVKLELASAYSASGQWRKAEDALIAVSVLRPFDVPLLVRIGEAVKQRGDLDGALQWYQRAIRTAPESPAPAFAAAQAQFDARRFDDASRAYTALQRFRPELGATLQALGAIGLLRARYDEAAWVLRRAVRESPRSLATRQMAAAAELGRRDAAAALLQLEPALRGWPKDPVLHYLLGLARSQLRDRAGARAALTQALTLDARYDVARAALAAVDVGGEPGVVFTPVIERPWGDSAALAQAVARFHDAHRELLAVRTRHQASVVSILALLGQGPLAASAAERVAPRRCPLRRMAPPWSQAQELMRQLIRHGVALEDAARFLIRHDDAGYSAGLLPGVRTQLAAARREYRVALSDLAELRAQWQRGVASELRRARCRPRPARS